MGPTALLPLWRKACWGFFRPKNPTASAGCEPTNLGTKGQHASSRPPKPLNYSTYYTLRKGSLTLNFIENCRCPIQTSQTIITVLQFLRKSTICVKTSLQPPQKMSRAGVTRWHIAVPTSQVYIAAILVVLKNRTKFLCTVFKKMNFATIWIPLPLCTWEVQ